jgi:2,3-diketo-5-methylthio-1-phosphopentane phosphatase
VVFFDFDNTITQGDVLDSIIEHFAIGDRWQELERDWQAGRLSTRECLDGQLRSLRLTWRELRTHLRGVTLDPAFRPILEFLREQQIEHLIVSDNFTIIVAEILAQQGLSGVPLFANDLRLADDAAIPSFPHSNPEHPGCAHCKRLQLLARPEKFTIYVGDGRSDLCPAVVADLVFAKDSLLRDLRKMGHPCTPIDDLSAVLDFLQSNCAASEIRT